VGDLWQPSATQRWRGATAAGRSPSYLTREIFDIQQGIRNGSNSDIALMRMVVEKLTPVDIIAYLVAMKPPMLILPFRST
jgi:hypothetical protein